jgi:uncharacterized protein YaeQ
MDDRARREHGRSGLSRIAVALQATLYNFDIDLSDADRGVYESLALRVAQHPSESPEYLVTRVLAYALEFTDGISFSRGGLSDTSEPAITVRDATGGLRAWIEIGNPDAARLHRAAKASPRVAVYTHRDVTRLADALRGERIHRAEALELYGIDRAVVGGIVDRLDRRLGFALSVGGGDLLVSLATGSLEGAVTRVRL